MPNAHPPKRSAVSTKAVLLLLGVCTAGGAGIAIGLQSMRHELTARLYKKQLEQLADDYTQLLDQYNQVVTQQAVTQLVVQDGVLSLSRRNAHGQIESIPVEANLDKPIYVDFIIQNDRLWIRSIYDASQPPEEALVIDPKVWGIDWDAASTQYGLVAYSRLTEGRWVVTASQNAGLHLRRVEDGEEIELVPAPPIHSFEAIDRNVQAEIGKRGALGSLLSNG